VSRRTPLAGQRVRTLLVPKRRRNRQCSRAGRGEETETDGTLIDVQGVEEQNSRSSSPVPARKIGENPIRKGTVWPVKDEMGDCSCRQDG